MDDAAQEGESLGEVRVLIVKNASPVRQFLTGVLLLNQCPPMAKKRIEKAEIRSRLPDSLDLIGDG